MVRGGNGGRGLLKAIGQGIKAAAAAVAVLASTGLASSQLVRAGDFNFSDFEFEAGGIAFVSPRYQGSKSYQAEGVPFAFPGAKNGDEDLTFTDIDSIQYRLVKYGVFEAGPLAGVWLGRNEHDGNKLGGLGRIDAGLVAGGFAAINTGMTKFTASVHSQVTGDDPGALLRLRADAQLPVAAGFKLLAGVGTNYADKDYMETEFGVSAAQALSSTAGLSAYNPSAGFKDVFAGAGFEAELTERWTAKVYGEYSRLVGDAGNSPVIETQDQFTGLLAITYQFGPLGVAPAAAAPLK